MVSLALKSPNSNEMNITKNDFTRIADYVDIVGISTYGYAFYSHLDKGNPDNLPTNWLSQIKDIAPSKAIAITETGWIAEDLNISVYGLNEQSDIDKQNKYVTKLLEEANSLNATFVIWFSIIDFDDLWSEVLGESPIAQIWKDTGLYDENLTKRKALDEWNKWLNKDYKE